MSDPGGTQEHVSIEVAGGRLPAYLFLPPGRRGPGVVVVQEIFGVSDYIQARCRDLAGLGYVVLAPELYWRTGTLRVDESRSDVLDQAMALMQRADWDDAVGDCRSALAWLRERPEVAHGAVGAVGFCYGGGLAFAAAATGQAGGPAPDALVSYYGSALPTLLGLADQVHCPQLHHFGLEDAYIPAPTVREIEEALTSGKRDVTFVTYEAAGHAFDNPSPAFHDEAACAQAWATTSAWLLERLPS